MATRKSTHPQFAAITLTGQARRSRTANTSTAKARSDSEAEQRRRLAFSATYEMQCLATAATRMRDDWEGCQEALSGMMSRIRLLSDIVYFSLRLGGDDETAGAPSLQALERTYHGSMPWAPPRAIVDGS